MFIIGFIIFCTYVFSIMFSVKEEQKEYKIKVDDSMDYDGHGNWGRFPPPKKSKNFEW